MSSIDAATLTKQLNAHALATRNNAMAKKRGPLAGLLAGWLSRRKMRRDEIWLKQQPDYLLRDIGISRTEIEAIIGRGSNR